MRSLHWTQTVSFPTCRHTPPRTPAQETLRWLAAEPFRIFFLSGALFSIAGVLLWPLFYAGWLPFYPSISHARVMIECFGGAFVLGFLGTAGPRMLAAPRLTPAELAALFALHLGGGWCHLRMQTAWGDALFLALLAGFAACLGGRALFRRNESVPPPMLLAALGLLCGIVGAAMWLNPAWHASAATYRLAGLFLYQGFLLGPIMGVGSFLFPRLLGGAFGEPAPGPEMRGAWLRTILAASALLASFAVEVGVQPQAGVILRAVAVGIALAGIRWRRAADVPPAGTLANALRAWCLPLTFLGVATPAFAYSRHVALEHFLFIGGFGLLCLIVASRVLFGHSGSLPDFAKISRIARTIVVLVVIAAFTRASAEFWPKIIVSHHLYAAGLWALAALLWLLWHKRRFFKKDPQPD